MVFNEISYLINDFPYPPSYLPRPLIHEKCLDNPIHDPNLFDKTVSEYFSSVMENEKNDNDMIRMEINVNPVSRGKVQEKSSLRKELSFNESVDSFNKSNVNIHAESCGSIVSHIEKSQSVVVFPLEKIKLFHSTNEIQLYMKDKQNNVYSMNKRLSISNPTIHDKGILRNSLQKIKFNKSKSMNNIKNSNGNNFSKEPFKHERSLLKELSTDFKKFFGYHKDESISFLSSKNSSYIDDNIEIIKIENNNNVNILNDDKEHQNNINDSLNKNMKHEKSVNHEVSKVLDNNGNYNYNNDNSKKNSNNNINESTSYEKSEKNEINKLNNEKQKINQETKYNMYDGNNSNSQNESDNNYSNSSLSEIEECQTSNKIEATRNSILKNKSKSITLLAPIASISLEGKKNKIGTDDDNSTEKRNNQRKNNQTNEYSKEYIRQISCQRIDRYRLNGGLVRDRIQRYKSNEALMNKPIKLSSNTSSITNDESNKSLNSVTNSKDDVTNKKLKLNYSSSDNPLFEIFKSNDDIIRERITVLNMSTHINSSPNSFSQLQDERINRENDLLENLELLHQGILGTIPDNKKEKLKEFLLCLTDENIDNYQKQIHEEYDKRQKLNNIENKPIMLNKYYINFGNSKKKIPIEEEVCDTLTIESKGFHAKYLFYYENKDSNFTLKISPMSGLLTKTETQNISFSLTCKTTMNKKIIIPLRIEDKYHFIIMKIRSQNSCFGVNIKNCDMESDTIFSSHQYNIPKILKMYRKILISNNAYQKGKVIFEGQPDENEVIEIKKQIINNESIITIDIHCIAYLFKNWFYELPRKLLYQINQQMLLENKNFDEYSDKITGLERVVFSWLIDCFVEIQKYLPNKDDIKSIIKAFVPGLYNIPCEENKENNKTYINNLELFINYFVDKRREELHL